MKGIISHLNLAPFIKQTVLSYQEHQLLAKFCTGICFTSAFLNSSFYLSLPLFFRREFRRREFLEIKDQYLETSTLLELVRVIAHRYGSTAIADQIWAYSEHQHDQKVARALKKGTFFHGYEYNCLASLQKATALKLPTFYEQPSQHHSYFTQIIKEQLAIYPSLKSPINDLQLNEKSVLRNQRRDQELALADYVIINSSFTEKTLSNLISPQQIIKIPYGFPTIKPMVKNPSTVLNFIYAGNLSMRKGIHILLKVWRQLSDYQSIHLTLIGKNLLPLPLFKNLKNITLIDNLPHAEVMDRIKYADVFVLPTLADGFGMVITESMSLGVPVICTESSAGPDLIENKINGLIVPPNNELELSNALEWCINNSEKLVGMGIKAQDKAKSYTWEDYRRSLAEAVNTKLKLSIEKN